MDSRTLGLIQHLGLNEGLIDVLSHLTAQGVNLPDKMSFGRASDMRITGHHRDTVYIHCKNHGPETDSCRGKRRLTSGMTCTDHTDICFNMVRILIHSCSSLIIYIGRAHKHSSDTGV